jgi:hypothetical protein
MVLVASTPEAPMTPTDPKFMLVAETIVQALVIVICTVKVVVTVAVCPTAGARVATTVSAVIGSHRTNFAAAVFRHPNIADQLIEATRDACVASGSQGQFTTASFDFRG